MAQNVTVVYSLVDRMTRSAEKIQKRIDKLERSLQNVDKLTSDIGKNRGMENAARRNVVAMDRLNQRLATTEKKLKSVTKATDLHSKKQDHFTEAVGKSSEKVIKQNKHLEEMSNWHKQGASNASIHAAQARGFGNELTNTSKKMSTQVRNLNLLDKASAGLESSLDGLILKENKLGDAMARKNIHARAQVKHLRDVDKSTEKATRSQSKYNRSMAAQSKLGQRIQGVWNKDGSFLQGFDMGVFQYEALKKIVMILPFIGTGFGGIASMASAASVAVGGLVGAVGRLSGAAALLPGIYGAIGVTAGSIKGIQSNILKPIMEGKDSLATIDKQIASAQQSLGAAQKRNAAATTPAGSASSLAAVEKAEASLGKLQAERAKIAKTMPRDAQKLLDATTKIKEQWQSAWFGEGGKLATQVINDSTKALEKAGQVLENSGGLFQRAADTYSNLLETGSRLLSNKKFMRPFADAVHSSFDNSAKLLKTAENLAPVTATIAANAAEMTSSVLDSVVGWSEAYTTADKIAEVQEKSAQWMERGEKSLRLWVPAIGDLLSAVTILTGPMGKSFQDRFTGPDGLFAQFDEWAKKVEKNKSLEAFNKNNQKVLSAVGDVFLSIGRVVGTIGADPKAAQATTDFLHQLGSGIESFGGFALKAMKETGPAMTGLFDAFGDAHKGSGDVIIKVMTSIIEAMTKMTRLADKVTPDKMLGVVAGITAVLSAAGAVVGTASMATKPLRGVVSNAAEKYSMTGLAGSGAAARIAGFTGDSQHVFVTNFPLAQQIPGGVGAGKGGGLGKAALGLMRNPLVIATVAVGVAAWYAKKKSDNEKERRDKRERETRKREKVLADRAGLSGEPEYRGVKRDLMKERNPWHTAITGREGKPVTDNDVREEVKRRNSSYEATQNNPFFKGAGHTTSGTWGLGRLDQKAMAAKVKADTDKTTDVGARALSRQEKVVRAATTRVGRAAVQPLARYVSATRALLSSLGVAGAPAGTPVSAPTGTPAAPVTDMRTSGAVAAMQGALPKFGGDSNVPVANRFGVGDSNKPAAGGAGKAAGLSSAMGPALSLAMRMGGTIASGLRPGAVTSSGLPSDHATGNAVDITGTPGLMAQIAQNANSLPGVKQVIYSPVGWSRNGGPFSPVTDAAVKADHYDHVHVAMGGSGAGGPMSALMGSVSPDLGKFPNTVMGQAVGALAERAKAAVDARLGQTGGDPSSMGVPTGSGASAFSSMISAAAAAYGAKADGLMRVAQHESGFNPTVSNDWDSNAQAGIPSKGLFQFIEPTYNSMSAQAIAANPSAWSGVANSWMNPQAQALTAAWAFANGQGSHWATANWYGNGGDFIAKKPQLIGVGDGGQERVTITPKRKAPGGNLRSVGSGNTFHTTVVVQGALFLNEDGRKQLGDMVGKHVAEQVIKASPNASIEKDL